MKISDETQAWIIKLSAVITAMPRWVAALLAAEGLAIPASWEWWLPMSAIMSAGMAVVEGWAFAYVFAAWRGSSGRVSRWLAVLASLSAVVFVAVVAPYVAASVRHVAIGDILSDDMSLWVWSSAVALSTIAIVASVGFAQRRATASTASRSETKSAKSAQQRDGSGETARSSGSISLDKCPWCDGVNHEPFKSQNQRNAHVGRCASRPKNAGGKK